MHVLDLSSVHTSNSYGRNNCKFGDALGLRKCEVQLQYIANCTELQSPQQLFWNLTIFTGFSVEN